MHCVAVLGIAVALAGKSYGQGQANAGSPKPDDQTAQRALVGNWRGVSATMATADGNRKTVSGQGDLMVVVIYEKKVTLRAGGKVLLEASYTLDPKQDPAATTFASMIWRPRKSAP